MASHPFFGPCKMQSTPHDVGPVAMVLAEVELILHLQAPVLLRPDLPDFASVNRDPQLPETGPFPHDPHDRGGRHSGLEWFHRDLPRGASASCSSEAVRCCHL